MGNVKLKIFSIKFTESLEYTFNF